MSIWYILLLLGAVLCLATGNLLLITIYTIISGVIILFNSLNRNKNGNNDKTT